MEREEEPRHVHFQAAHITVTSLGLSLKLHFCLPFFPIIKVFPLLAFVSQSRDFYEKVRNPFNAKLKKILRSMLVVCVGV